MSSGPNAATPQIPGVDLIEVIGSGGSGVVYRGHQRAFGRDVAVKVVRNVDEADGGGATSRWEREVAAVGRLSNHPNIVPVFDAGITDFALFNDDYKRAKEEDTPLSAKWNDLIADQTDAYNRALARTRAELVDRPTSPFDSGSNSAQHDAVPSLTPDTSPRLVDDLDFDSGAEESTSTLSLPYRTKIVTPEDLPNRPASAPIDIPRSRFNLPALSESAVEDEDFADPAAPAFLLYRHSQRADRRRNTARPAPPPMRPGMSAGNRTLSGKLHVWKRPSWDLYSVFEEREEEMAQDDSRGRGRGDGALRKKKGMEALRG